MIRVSKGLDPDLDRQNKVGLDLRPNHSQMLSADDKTIFSLYIYQQEKDDYGALIEQLGGTVFDALSFDSRCTHLVISK